ncbi:unnamed protein product [Effrenium voratum]|nr:unnamed protein product [Effrenium voratum]
MQLHVYLASGTSCSVALPPESSIRELKVEAQSQLERRSLRLLCGSEKLDLSRNLVEVGLRDGDSITAIAQHAKLSSTQRAFALYVEGGSVVTWGDPVHGGDIGQVREQLVQVHQIQQPGARAVGAGPADSSKSACFCCHPGRRFKQISVLLLPSWPTALW